MKRLLLYGGLFIAIIGIIFGTTYYIGCYTPVIIKDAIRKETFCLLRDQRIPKAKENILYSGVISILKEAEIEVTYEMKWIFMIIDDKWALVNNTENRVTFGLAFDNIELRDKLFSHFKKSGFRKVNLPPITGAQIRFPINNILSLRVAKFKCIKRIFRYVEAHQNYTRIRDDRDWPQQITPLVLIRNKTLSANYLEFFYPLGDNYKEYQVNLLSAPAYKKSSLVLFKKQGRIRPDYKVEGV